MKRTAILRRSPLRRVVARRRARVTRYQRRERAHAYMLFVKTLTCWALETAVPGHRCSGPIEADHAGRRPIGRKCDDHETMPVCQLAHRQRTDHSGPFRSWSKAQMRRWLDEGIVATQLAAVAAGVWSGPVRAEAAG